MPNNCCKCNANLPKHCLYDIIKYINEQKNNPNGLASLDNNGLVMLSQIPSINSHDIKHINNIPIENRSPNDDHIIMYNAYNNIWRVGTMFDDDDYVYFYNEFLGSELGSNWVINSTGTNSDIDIIDSPRGEIQILAGNELNSKCEMSFSTHNISLANKSFIKIRIKPCQLTNTKISFGGIDTNSNVSFVYDSSESIYWQTYVQNESGSEKIESIISANIEYQTFEIKMNDDNVQFYYNKYLLVTHTTYLPMETMKLYIDIKNKTTTNKKLNVDYVKLRNNR